MFKLIKKFNLYQEINDKDLPALAYEIRLLKVSDPISFLKLERFNDLNKILVQFEEKDSFADNLLISNDKVKLFRSQYWKVITPEELVTKLLLADDYIFLTVDKNLYVSDGFTSHILTIMGNDIKFRCRRYINKKTDKHENLLYKHLGLEVGKRIPNFVCEEIQRRLFNREFNFATIARELKLPNATLSLMIKRILDGGIKIKSRLVPIRKLKKHEFIYVDVDDAEFECIENKKSVKKQARIFSLMIYNDQTGDSEVWDEYHIYDIHSIERTQCLPKRWVRLIRLNKSKTLLRTDGADCFKTMAKIYDIAHMVDIFHLHLRFAQILTGATYQLKAIGLNKNKTIRKFNNLVMQKEYDEALQFASDLSQMLTRHKKLKQFVTYFENNMDELKHNLTDDKTKRAARAESNVSRFKTIFGNNRKIFSLRAIIVLSSVLANVIYFPNRKKVEQSNSGKFFDFLDSAKTSQGSQTRI